MIKYKYIGSWLTEDGRCDLEIKTRIGMAKARPFGSTKTCSKETFV